MSTKLVRFDDLPLGTRFRYAGKPEVFVILEKRREHSDTEPMCGTIADWRPDLIGQPGPHSLCQGLYHFNPTEAPDGVEPID